MTSRDRRERRSRHNKRDKRDRRDKRDGRDRRDKGDKRSKVFLVALDVHGQHVDKFTLTYEEFYEGSSPIMANNDYRAQRGIRKIKGEIYNHLGILKSKFENMYGEGGEYLRGCRS